MAGALNARDERSVQNFPLHTDAIYVKYIKVEMVSHYGREHYCPLTILRYATLIFVSLMQLVIVRQFIWRQCKIYCVCLCSVVVFSCVVVYLTRCCFRVFGTAVEDDDPDDDVLSPALTGTDDDGLDLTAGW